MAKKIGDNTIREFALVGARARLASLEAEVAALLAAFPELRRGGRGAAKDGAPAKKSRRGRKKPMTAAERKAVSERMRKYWAERRAKK